MGDERVRLVLNVSAFHSSPVKITSHNSKIKMSEFSTLDQKQFVLQVR